ncbi:MAG: hypothetical protein ACOCRX_03025 [Candidatus Woesearchaeota archaeon]
MNKQHTNSAKYYRIILFLISFIYLIFALFYYHLPDIDDPMPFTHRLFAMAIFLLIFILSYVSYRVKTKLQTITTITIYLAIAYLVFLNYISNYKFELSLSIIVMISIANLFFRVNKLVSYINIALTSFIVVTLLIVKDLEVSAIAYFLAYISAAGLTYFVSYLRTQEEENIKSFMANMPVAFAHHKIICDDKDNPVDYIFFAGK